VRKIEGELLLALGCVVKHLCGRLIGREQGMPSLECVLRGTQCDGNTAQSPRLPYPKVKQVSTVHHFFPLLLDFLSKLQQDTSHIRADSIPLVVRTTGALLFVGRLVLSSYPGSFRLNKHIRIHEPQIS
jgi:hypothetical protein